MKPQGKYKTNWGNMFVRDMAIYSPNDVAFVNLGEIVDRLNTYHEALTKAHEILLHEMDNGRTPTMLQGVGLGYFEDVIAGLDHPKQRD